MGASVRVSGCMRACVQVCVCVCVCLHACVPVCVCVSAYMREKEIEDVNCDPNWEMHWGN